MVTSTGTQRKPIWMACACSRQATLPLLPTCLCKVDCVESRSGNPAEPRVAVHSRGGLRCLLHPAGHLMKGSTCSAFLSMPAQAVTKRSRLWLHNLLDVPSSSME